MNAIHWVGGSKGGVGKSAVSMALLDYLGEKDPLLVETDTANPDVAKAYRETVKTEMVDLDGTDGWIRLIDLCTAHDGPVVINSAARTDVEENGVMLDEAIVELGRDLIALWVINTQRDSIELLKEFRQGVAAARIHVVRNLYFGPIHKFDDYDRSEIRKEIEAAGGLTLNFPALADRVAKELYSERIPIDRAAGELTLGNRIELGRWRRLTHGMFDSVINGEGGAEDE